jgi:hypothetical protein
MHMSKPQCGGQAFDFIKLKWIEETNYKTREGVLPKAKWTPSTLTNPSMFQRRLVI